MHLAQQLILPTPDPGDARRALCVEDGPAVVEDAGVRVPAGATQGFATYFSAFPASYWARWAGVATVRLEVAATGAGSVRLVRSDAGGAASVVAVSSLEPGETTVTTVTIDADVSGLTDGGWLWFEVDAGDTDLVVADARWLVDVAPRRTGDVCLSITTMDKPEFCVATLRRIAASAPLAEAAGTVLVIDQGSRRVVDHPGYAEVAAALGDRLTVIDQRNLGGSGGFSRGMLEALDRPDADAVLILDDDVEVEPEALLRAIRFHRAARTPVVVGGHMLDLHRPTVLNSFSEVVHERSFNWGPPQPDQQWHDLAAGTLRDTPWLHARGESDFNGWWMCLIPTAVLRDVGLSLPLFLKWDDAEFGLRARDAGHATVSFPGAALWHVAWTEKDDTVEWQAYLHVRNRVAAALLHARRPRAALLLPLLLANDLKLLLGLRYYAVDLHVRALRDVLAGPGDLHADLERVVPAARAVGREYPETVVRRAGDPVFDAAAPRARAGEPGPRPASPAALAGLAVRGVVRNLRAAAGGPAPRATLTREQATWWEVPGHDSVLVLAGDGASGVWLRRDPRRFWRLAGASVAAHARLALRWSQVSARWRAAAPGLVDPGTWRATFAPRAPH
ncbi:glycosyltransferase [Krasilnikoviella flava]|uniref:Galactofuranosylgalactofuranosylrhamnosyl-N-acetylglucosaminyl-diphospho-decaprenol beta-1,5/1,6-galactofuranosyltransferase n=1 Tax=Krasilnikoviella flava TaxID=526729 RepID=A0A1T5IA42_9MICO|nr:glycosyltransferase [Krasilnikoviella flava]SKC36041.1 galactofuranosylgalactofuranosylrhamnosyl-N-acetylglucosaminyl-diphospho-decaprenol beta-1,5/1,6-galactofuranosyltransferase [Krasilnikoviella flava]